MSTKIEWCWPPGYRGDVWNPLVGCSRKSSGCAHCYAERMAARIANSALAKVREKSPVTELPVPVLDAARRILTPTQVAYLEAVRWRDGGLDGPKYYTDIAMPQWSRKLVPLPHTLAAPLKTKTPTAYFVNSMSDLFHESVPFHYIDQVFAVMALCPQHIFIVLTKRPERMAEYMERFIAGRSDVDALVLRIMDNNLWVSSVPMPERGQPLPNVWLGTSVEDQATADARIPHLLMCPAAVRFLSCEPLLGPVSLDNGLRISWQCSGCKGYFSGGYQKQCPGCEKKEYWSGSHQFNSAGGQTGSGIHWVIAGGESGPKARPMHPDWARGLRDQCQAAGVPFFFKQWGEWIGKRPEQLKPSGASKVHEWNGGVTAWKVGKRESGRLLDGVEHNGWPKVIGGKLVQP